MFEQSKQSILFSGLTSGAFRGEQSIREVVCTCEQLSPDIDVLFMMVYKVPSTRVLASFSYYKRECWNSDYFVSCVIDEADSRMSRLAILVADLPEGSSRAYGCNVSTMAPGGVLRVLSWRVDVVHPWSKLRSPWWGIQVPAPTPYRPSSGLSITCFWGIFLFSRLSMYLEFFSAL